MGKGSVLAAENFTLGTGNVLAAFRTAAAGSDASNVFVKRIEVSQRGSTTLGMCGLEVATRDTTGTLTMTSTTPRTYRPLGAAASGLTGNTAPAGGDGRSGTNSSADSGGTYTNVFYADFPNTAGYMWKADPEEQLWVPPSTVWVVRFVTAPAGTTGWTVSVWLDEHS